jgi:hypothetical protein
MHFTIIVIELIIVIIFVGSSSFEDVGTALLPQESAKREGHFVLFNCLVLGHQENVLQLSQD